MSPSRRRFAMMGGFLGAGKTTAILEFCRWLSDEKELKVGVITNDQANGLVDTALANGGKFAVREIGGGCLCCKSESLVEAMGSFSAKVQPDVLIGEPVGSCTDLVSTVLGPLRTIYKTEYELSPLSVMVDPFRAERIVKGNGTSVGGFSEDVNYIYRKQLEEAEIIVVNKSDVFERKRLAMLCKALAERYPKAEVLRVSARTGAGLEEWWERLLAQSHSADRFMSMDYKVYAEGEARLGWVNGEYEVAIQPALKRALHNAVEVNGNGVLETVAASIKMAFRRKKIEVAHLKMAIMAEIGGDIPVAKRKASTSNAGELGAIQWVRTSSEPEFTRRFRKSFKGGKLLLNLRAEADPVVLTGIVEKAFEAVGEQVQFTKKDYAAFRPAPPKPTHRMTQGEGAPPSRVSKTGRGLPNSVKK